MTGASLPGYIEPELAHTPDRNRLLERFTTELSVDRTQERPPLSKVDLYKSASPNPYEGNICCQRCSSDSIPYLLFPALVQFPYFHTSK